MRLPIRQRGKGNISPSLRQARIWTTERFAPVSKTWRARVLSFGIFAAHFRPKRRWLSPCLKASRQICRITLENCSSGKEKISEEGSARLYSGFRVERERPRAPC